MKNNVVEFPNNNSIYMPESIDELITRAMDIIEFAPICKSASGDWEDDECEYYLDDNGDVLMGYLAYEWEEFCEEGFDGDMEVIKQIFITPESKCTVFYTTLENHYCGCCDEVHSKLSRIFSKDQSLTPDETEDILYQLLIELNQVNEQ